MLATPHPEREDYLRTRGYRVVRVSEEDFLRQPRQTVEQALAEIDLTDAPLCQ
jgi:very-short-patch-repair endonuclease